MITPKDDEQSILSAIDRFVACLGEDKATVATCVDHYIHLETDAVSRFNIVTLRARLPVDAVGIIQIPGSALVFYLHTVYAGRYFYAALHDLATRCPSFEEARSLLQAQAAIRRAAISKTPGVDKHAQGIILHDVNTVLNSLRTQVPPPSPEQGRSEKAKRTVNDDDLDDTNTTLHQSVPQPAAASSEDSQSPQKVQQQSPIEADPLDWDPFEVDLPPQPDRSVAHNLSSFSDDSFVHQTPDQTSSAIEERFKHYESLYNVPAYIDVPSSNISSSAQDTLTSAFADPFTALADSKGSSILSPAPIQPQTSTMASNSNHPQPEPQAMPSAKRRRITLPNPLQSLLPGEEIQASLVSGILQSLCDLIPHRAVCSAPRGPATDATAVISQTQSRIHGIFDQSPKEAVVIMPLRTNHHWALAFVRVTGQKQVVIENYNAASDQELTKEAEGLMCSLFDVPQDNDTALPKLCPRSSWNSISRHSVSQVDHQDSGVGVLIHSLYALAATSIPKEVDWLLWRRVLAAYKSARDSPLAAGGSSTHLTPPGDVLAQLRREHADSLGTRSGVRVPVPADSIIRRALLDDANWLSVSSDEAPALDEALAELRAKLTSVPDKLKAKAHLARQSMYDINTLVAVLLGQAAEKPGPASNHLKNCQKDMDKIKSLIPLMRGGKMAKEKMQAALETAEGATRLAAARKAEEDNNRQRSIQGLKAMQGEIQKIERELNSADEEDSDEHQNDDKIDHNDLPGEDDEADLNDSADKDSDDDDEQPSHDEELTDDEEPSDGEEERNDAIRHLNCDVTFQADLRAVLDSISRIDKTGADAGVSGEFENFYNVFNVHIKLTKPGCGVLDANLHFHPQIMEVVRDGAQIDEASTAKDLRHAWNNKQIYVKEEARLASGGNVMGTQGVNGVVQLATSEGVYLCNGGVSGQTVDNIVSEKSYIGKADEVICLRQHTGR
ncbi:hypothetical protein K456DRAFT_1736078 [Colletotrichum gloeosporioides 23]|nr:hypothetical protein K456DRAFT_1736078 [Colletotrichum gloeosporioides 23]